MVSCIPFSFRPFFHTLKHGEIPREAFLVVSKGTQYCELSLRCCHAGFLEDVVSGRCAACVTATRCDTASADEAAAVLGAQARHKGLPPITSVINSGGVLADAILASQTAGALQPTFETASKQALCSPVSMATFQCNAHIVEDNIKVHLRSNAACCSHHYGSYKLKTPVGAGDAWITQ